MTENPLHLAQADELFDKIAHGDDEHRAWLKKELREWFAVRTHPASESLPKVVEWIEFAPAFKSVSSLVNGAFHQGTYWYAEGWIAGQRFEFSTQESRADAEELCARLNTVLAALAERPS